MPHRPLAGGMLDHGVIGFMAVLFAAAVGLSGGGLSLLLLWPGWTNHGVSPPLKVDVHVLLLIFFSAVPASLGGLAVSSIPDLIGSDRSAYPWLPAVGLGLTVTSLCMLADGVLQSRSVMPNAGVATLAIATIGTAVDLIVTILNERTVPYSVLAPSVWTTLIAAAFTVCAAPIMAALSMVSLSHRVALEGVQADLVWPALCVVLVLMIGLVSDIFSAPRIVARSPALPIIILSSVFAAAFYMTWATSVLHHSSSEATGLALRLMTDALVVPVEAVWLVMLCRRRPAGVDLIHELPVLFAIGFAVVLAIGVADDAIGHNSHDAISLAVVFGLFAGFFRMTRGWIADWFTKSVVHVQFWCLLAGTVILLVPQLLGLQAIGAALLSLSIVLFATSLCGALVRRFNGVIRGGKSKNFTPRLDEGQCP